MSTSTLMALLYGAGALACLWYGWLLTAIALLIIGADSWRLWRELEAYRGNLATVTKAAERHTHVATETVKLRSDVEQLKNRSNPRRDPLPKEESHHE